MGRTPELFNSGYYEWLSGARKYVSSAESALLREWCMRVVHESDARKYMSSAREYMSSAVSALLREWCMRLVHEGSAREYVSRAREWCTLVNWAWDLQDKL